MTDHTKQEDNMQALDLATVDDATFKAMMHVKMLYATAEPDEIDLPIDIMNSVRSGDNDERHDVFWNVVMMLKHTGFTRDAAIALLEKYPDGVARGYRGRLRPEVERIYAKLRKIDDNKSGPRDNEQRERKRPNGGQGPERDFEARVGTPVGGDDNEKVTSPDWLKMADWDGTETPQQEWTVKDKFPRRQVALFTGPGGEGKSTIGLHLCCAHVLGRDWLNELPELGASIFLDAEDEQNVARIRLDAIRRHYVTTFGELEASGLYVLPLAGKDAVLATKGRNGLVVPTPLFQSILRDAEIIKPQTIVVASAANMFAGDENDRSQVTQFINLLTRLAIAANGSVILIAHPSVSGMQNDTGISGSTGWHNAVRARMYLHSVRTDGEEPPDPDVKILEFRKNQYGPPATSIRLKWRNGLFLPDLSGTSTLDRAVEEARAEHVFEGLLKRYAREGRTVSPNRKAPNYAPAEFVDQPEAKLAHLAKRDLQAAMDRLFRQLVIKAETSGPPSKQRTRIVHADG
jgi:RecA-family ATPase